MTIEERILFTPFDPIEHARFAASAHRVARWGSILLVITTSADEISTLYGYTLHDERAAGWTEMIYVPPYTTQLFIAQHYAVVLLERYQIVRHALESYRAWIEARNDLQSIVPDNVLAELDSVEALVSDPSLEIWIPGAYSIQAADIRKVFSQIYKEGK